MNNKGLENCGFHNADLEGARQRLKNAKSYDNLSTVWISAIRGPQKCDCGCGRIVNNGLAPKVVSSWIGLMRPMNQMFAGPFFIEGKEVGEAYNAGIEMILANETLSKWKYVLTVEEDNIPPSDGILKLYESMDRFDVVQGLYWTKGEGGQPMIYGNPKETPKNFIPQVPLVDQVQEANGLGMGFNLFKMEIFKRMPKPWFKTVQENGSAFSQDLFFYNNAGKEGYHFACDNRIKVGHYDIANDFIW
jgi:hypothetical protein